MPIKVGFQFETSPSSHSYLFTLGELFKFEI